MKRAFCNWFIRIKGTIIKKNSHSKKHSSMNIKNNSLTILVFSALILAFNSCTRNLHQKTMEDEIQTHVQSDWVSVGLGGGGHVYVPTVNPHDPDHVFVSCDMTSSFVTFNGGESWRMFNLRGVISFYAFDPSNDDVVYAKSSSLYRSTDKGATWNLLYPSPSNMKGIVSKRDHAEETSLEDIVTPIMAYK